MSTLLVLGLLGCPHTGSFPAPAAVTIEGEGCEDVQALPRWSVDGQSVASNGQARPLEVDTSWEVQRLGPQRVLLTQVPDASQPAWVVELHWVPRCKRHPPRPLSAALASAAVQPLLGPDADLDWGEARMSKGFVYNATASGQGRQEGVWVRWVEPVSLDGAEVVLAAACGREEDYQGHCVEAVGTLEAGLRGMVD